MTKISVIIPCYNSYKYMEKCLISLQNQTFNDFEVIFIDDCSTDSTYSDLEKYLSKTDLKWTLIRNERNGGPGVSRNNGIEAAKGQFISFMDSDDWYEDDFLEEMYNKSKVDSLEIVMCDYFRRYSNGNKKEMHPTGDFNIKMTKADFLARSFDSLCCMLIKKELFEGVKMPSQFNAEDVAIIPVIISKSNSIGYISKPLYNYFYREGSLSTSTDKNKNVDKSIITAYEYIRNNISKEFIEEIEYIGIKNVLYGAVVCAIENKKSKEYIYGIIDTFEQQHPNWFNNRYFKYLSKSKKIFIEGVKNRNYNYLRILSKIRTFMFKIKLA